MALRIYTVAHLLFGLPMGIGALYVAHVTENKGLEAFCVLCGIIACATTIARAIVISVDGLNGK